MTYLNLSLHKLTFIQRLTIALALFGLALWFRFILVPQGSGGPFLTFYPAIILSFYLCGAGAGALVAVLSGLAGLYFLLHRMGNLH